MRVLAFSDRYLPGLAGPELALHGFLRGLVTLGHESVVVTATDGPPGARRDRVVDGVRVYHGRKDPTFARYLETEHPDVVLAQLAWTPQALAAAASAGVPVAALIHSPSCARRIAGAAIALAIYPSQALLNECPAGVHRQVIHPPVDAARLVAPEAPRDCVTVINLAEAKGGRTVAALAARMRGRRFLCVRGGYGEQVPVEGPNVELLDGTYDIGQVYARSRIVLVPSQAESFGLVGVEAQAAGVPVIASDLPALRESLGPSAAFIPPGDAAGWASAIERLGDPDLWQRAADGGRVWAAQYTGGAAAAALETLLQRLVSGDLPREETPVRTTSGDHAPLLCDRGAPGQNAFTGALVRELGFRAIPFTDVEPALAAGRPVLVNGWFDDYGPLAERHPGLLHAVWHSGLAGSDLMCEGASLVAALSHAQHKKIKLHWLERRDEPPPGATHLHPVWSPDAIRAACPTPVEKVPGAVMAGMHGHLPTAPKNVVATIVGAQAGGGIVHLGLTSLERRNSMALDLLLRPDSYVAHPALDPPAFLRLLASMELLVHTSLSETWPTMVLQAVYLGTPVVLSDVVAWSELLSDRAQSLCIARPVTSTAEIGRLVRHLLGSPGDRAYLLEEQRRVLDSLYKEHIEAAMTELRASGFPIRTEGMMTHDQTALQRAPDVTCFLLTTGEPSTAECLQRLRAQDVPVRIEIIDSIAPMDRAFQRMLDACATPLFVQVDADMMLEPGAVRSLIAGMQAQPETTAIYCEWLWDSDYPRPIVGVKIYRHGICTRFPYQSVNRCEVDQVNRLRAAGHCCVVAPQPQGASGCAGVHHASQTPALAYRRFYRLAALYTTEPDMAWVHRHIEPLWDAAQDGTPLTRARLMGAIAGLAARAPTVGELDFRVGMPELPRLWEHFGIGGADQYVAPAPMTTPPSPPVVRSERAQLRVLPQNPADRPAVSDGPVECTLYVTRRCTYSCTFCMRQLKGRVEKGHWIPPGESAPRQDMEPELVRLILKQFPTIRGACLAGFGEPLMHPQLGEIIDILHGAGVTIGLITNGSLINANKANLTRWKLGYVSVSIYGTTPEKHASTTGCGVGGFKVVADGLRWLANETDHNAGCSFVVHRGNIDEVPDVIRLANDADAKFVNLVNLIPHGDPNDSWFMDHVLTTTSPELGQLEAMRSLPGADRVKVWPTPIDLVNGPPRKCESPFVSLGIDEWGHTTACRRAEDPTIYRGEHFQVEDMWNSTQNVQLRRTFRGGLPLREVCKKCFGCWIG